MVYLFFLTKHHGRTYGPLIFLLELVVRRLEGARHLYVGVQLEHLELATEVRNDVLRIVARGLGQRLADAGTKQS